MNPFKASETDSFIVPSTDIAPSTGEPKREQVLPGILEKKLSAEAEEIAIAVRKQQQNNKVIALKNKFHVRVNLPKDIANQ